MSGMSVFVELHVLTPVIINTGDVYGFCELYPPLKEKKGPDGSYELYQLNMMKFLDGLDAQKKNEFTSRACRGMSCQDNSLLQQARQLLTISTETIVRPCKAYERAYHVIQDKPMQQIAKIMTHPLNGKPYIPGSSIKGALRTGFLEQLRQEKNITVSPVSNRMREARDFEAKVYGQPSFKVQDDIFKFIKVSDFDFADRKEVVYIGKVGEDSKMPIYSGMTGCEWVQKKKVVATGSIQFDDQFFNVVGRNPGKEGVESFFAAVSRYFLETAKQEKWEVLLPQNEWEETKCKLEDKGFGRGFLLKLGHYAGIQNYTFHIENGNPRGKNKDPEINIKGGKTINTVENGLPPGFCMINVKPET